MTDTESELDWQNQHSTLLSRLRWMLSEGLHTDVDFLVGCNEVAYLSAHKVILAACSSVFERMLYRKSLKDPALFEVPDIHPVGFRIMLKYLYEDNITFMNEKEAFHALIAARKYNIHSLENKCMENIIDIKLTAENIFIMLEFSHLLQLYDIEERCISFLEEHAREAFENKNCYSISLETILLVLKLPLLRIPETELLNYASDWVNTQEFENQPDLTESIIYSLLSNIHFSSVGLDDFCAFIDKYENMLLKDDEIAILRHLLNPELSPLPDWCCIYNYRENLTETIPVCRYDITAQNQHYTSVVSWFECKYEVQIKDPFYRDVQSITLTWNNRKEDLPLIINVTVKWNTIHSFKVEKLKKLNVSQEVVIEFDRKVLLPKVKQLFSVRVDFKQPSPVCFFKPEKAEKSLVECKLLSSSAMSPSKRKVVFNKAHCIKDLRMICWPRNTF